MRTMAMMAGLLLSAEAGAMEGGGGGESIAPLDAVADAGGCGCSPDRPGCIAPADAVPDDAPVISPAAPTQTETSRNERDAVAKAEGLPIGDVRSAMAVVKPGMTDADLDRRFNYHPPKPGQPERYAKVRSTLCEAAKVCRDVTPGSPEQTRAVNAMHEAMMLFNASIAIHG